MRWQEEQRAVTVTVELMVGGYGCKVPVDERRRRVGALEACVPALVTLPWLLLALLALAIGVVGIVVPGLPTTPFVLLAAGAAARGSPRLHAWLLAHRRFGPPLQAWERERAIPRGAKWASTIGMTVCAVLMFVLVRPIVWPIVGTGTMALVSWWIWSRPEGGRGGHSRE